MPRGNPLDSYRQRGFLTSAEVREVLGLSANELKRLVFSGKLNRCDSGGARTERKFSLEDIEAYVKEQHG